MRNCTRRGLLSGAIALTASAARAVEADVPAVAAASDLQFALEDLAARFRAETGQAVRITYGSSGNFVRQLRQGAPFQLFLSADEGFVFQLAEAGKTADRGALYAEGRIVLFAPHGSPLTPDPTLRNLREALAAGRVQRFAIASPEHAPYGRAAAQALQSQGLWDAIQPRLVLGENVTQAAQFASSGATQGGIFAYSLALAPEIGTRGTYALLQADWHAALRQRMVLLHNAGATARAFYTYLHSPAARAVLRSHGFTLPGELS